MVKTEKNKHKSRIRQRKSRRVLGSRAYKNYSDDMLKLACEAVSLKQISSRDAERQFGIPRRTIVNKIKKSHIKSVGHPTHLTSAEEKNIVRVLQASSDFGSPLTKIDLKVLVHEYLKKNSREHVFKNKIPGDAWVQGFLARHAEELSVRITQNISRARAEKGPQELAEYFENLRVTLKDIPATNIVNFDETNLSDDPGSSRCIFRRGVRYPERIANSTKGSISVMFTAIASGQCLPLYVVYKATNMYSEWISGGSQDVRYNFTKSGWFNSAMFEDYFENIIIPWAREAPGTKAVICDNLSSHLSVKVIELCEQYNIKFVFIPPRSTHLTQPLDVAFFGPLKKSWRQILYQYKLRNPNQISLNKKHFPRLLVELTEAIKLNEAKNIKSGFRATGIFPLNPQEVLKKTPEMHEEMMSYGLDQTLIDYLKETRGPKQMAVKRNKKVNCESGKSVTVTDLNIICPHKDTLKSNSKKKDRNKVAEIIIAQTTHESRLYLDEQTGILTNVDLRTKNENRQETFEINRASSYLLSALTLKFPETLSRYCITTINSLMYQSLGEMQYLMFISENNDNCSNYLPEQAPTVEASVYSQKKTTSKITILSNELIKAPPSDVHCLRDVSLTENSIPFIAKYSRDLPKCLQSKASKNRSKDNYKTDKKINKIDRKNKRQGCLKEKGKKLRGHISIKRKKKPCMSDSSTTSTDSIIELDDTDNSEYETMSSYYISECLAEFEEKENVNPTEIPYGLNDIQYFDEEQDNLKEGDWIVARFATKKSLKHFVGKILSVTNKKPAIKFVRKVKQIKCIKGTTFTFPPVDDVCTIDYLEDIVLVLPEPTISRRGQFIFDVDFSNLNIQ